MFGYWLIEVGKVFYWELNKALGCSHASSEVYKPVGRAVGID